MIVWLIGGTGIHTRLKISRPVGLAGSNPASATTLKGGRVAKVKQWFIRVFEWLRSFENPRERFRRGDE